MKECRTSSVVPRLFATPWNIAVQAPLSIEFSRQEYCSGLPCPLSRDLPNPGIEPKSPALQADSLPAEPPGKPQNNAWNVVNPLEMSAVVAVVIILPSLEFRCV